ncbi:uncharacterized protein CANTADRAFT_48889 [Suhomyces tanzawaensis NRRL Y-17324]|uniref:RRM domain-containing protein n=1 Tax=Suhomyces tanzawaensis NRRL Y-17324 TaxID=984487 RepID=A0A1E4SK50_9ASCO|nr:uncharacterized protein CANTADRAFT_48889 [Suhomyces tanzawaensis NRRL Y-17324]ODV79870.1 hypothetical protein CANTADRAFT_48889 [Suhomyces tanzawaensis NRRL Y-17324]
MDLRNLSSTPNQMDAVMQRRPSLSSLSSTSGYSGANTSANTPQLSNQRLSSTSRNNLHLQNSWLNQGSSHAGLALPSAANVGPWVEQQQQQQQSTLNNMDNKVIESLLQKDKAPSIAATSQAASTSSIEDDAKDNDNDLDNDNDNDNDDDELIPTAIVIKNIPFAIKKEQLLDVMTKLNLPLPYAFNYHFDNGVFRGLAFANFTSTDETSLVVNQLNGREIGGRKLRVEYKKMLPLQERERIEREKREKRGQLEEQHRSTSNASLASLLSAASTTAATKNLSVNGTNSGTTTERFMISLPLSTSYTNLPIDLNFNDPETLELYTQLALYRDDMTKSIFELAISPANLNLAQRKVLSVLCSYLNLLELFDNGLIIIRRKPVQLQLQQSGQQQPQSHSSSMLNLNQLGQLGAPTHPELLRSQSQSALPLPRLRQQTSTPIQQHFPQYQSNGQMPPSNQQHQQHGPPQQSRPYSQQFNVYQQQQQHTHQQHQQSGQTPQMLNAINGAPPQVVTPTMGSSAASLLRTSNNRSYVDVRSTPPLSNYQTQPPLQQGSVTGSPTPQHHHSHGHGTGPSAGSGAGSHHPSVPPHFFQGPSSNSQPSTPMASSDISSRFQPFGQHAHLTGSFTSLQQSGSEDFGNNSQSGNQSGNNNERLSSKFNSLNLANNGFDSPNSGIWGPK